MTTAERASGNAGSWRETIVIGANGRFSRSRQIDASGNGVGPLTYRSGTFTTSGNELTMTEDCTSVDGGPGTNTMQYNVTTDECGEPTLRYSVTGFRFTFKRR